ncbi:hypothetical protein [Actinocorallia aurea]
MVGVLRVLGWAAVGWLLAEPYVAAVDQGVAVAVCVAVIGCAVGVLGAASALAAAATMALAGVAVPELLWWVVPVLAGLAAGARRPPLDGLPVRSPEPVVVFAERAAIFVVAVPAVAWATHGHGLVDLVLVSGVWVTASRFRTESAALTRYNRTRVRLGTVVWVLAATVLAAGPVGQFLMDVCPPGVAGFAAAAGATVLVTVLTHLIYWRAVRLCLSRVGETSVSVTSRAGRGPYAGLYAATLFPANLGLMSGVLRGETLLAAGCASAIVLFVPAGSRLQRALRYAVDRLDTAEYLFSAGARRAELVAAWRGDFDNYRPYLNLMEGEDRLLAVPSGPGDPLGYRRKIWLDRLRPRYSLVESAIGEGTQVAFGVVDERLWLPYLRRPGRPAILDISLQWTGAAFELLELLRDHIPDEPVAQATGVDTMYHLHLLYCHQARAAAYRLHGRIEEAIIDYAEAGTIARRLGLPHVAAIMAGNTLSLAPPQLETSSEHFSLLTSADEEIQRALRDENLHPEVKFQLALTTASMYFQQDRREEAERMRALALQLRAANREEWSGNGSEQIEVGRKNVMVSIGYQSYGTVRWPADHGVLDNGFASVESPSARGYHHNLAFITAIISGVTEFHPRAMPPISVRSDGTIDVAFAPAARWAAAIAQRGGRMIAAELDAVLGVELRATDPLAAADHLLAAFEYKQFEHFSVLDENLRLAVRGSAERFSELTIAHLARLAMEVPSAAGSSAAERAWAAASSVKSRNLAELLGEKVPPPPSPSELLAREVDARDRFLQARTTTAAGRHHQARAAREDLEHAWAGLIDEGGTGAEYAALRAGRPLDYGELQHLLTDLH